MDNIEYLYFEGKNEAANYTKITPRTFVMLDFHALAFKNFLAANTFFLEITEANPALQKNCL